MFWKKVNRGLLLGALLLTLLVVVIVVGEVRFKQETPLIKERGLAYLIDLATLQCDPKGELGQPLSASEVARQKEKMNQLLKTHWYGNLSESEYSGTGVSGVRQAYDEYLGNKLTVLFSTAEVHLLEDQVSVKKDGPNRAIMQLSAEIKTEYIGDGSGFFFGGYNPGYGYYNETWTDEEGNALIDNTEYSGIYYVHLSFELERVGGEWKIVAFSGGGYETGRYAKGEQ